MAVRMVSSGRLHGLDVCWLGFWLEREVYIVPRQTAFGFVQRANVIRPADGEHEEHFCLVQTPAVYRVVLSSESRTTDFSPERSEQL